MKSPSSLFLCMLIALPLLAQQSALLPDSSSWDLTGAKIVHHDSRQCIIGTAVLKGVEFQDGVIEVDILVTGLRSYPGLMVRVASPTNFEDFYLRPHRANLYPDALQYSPRMNGFACWQLYNGEGYTAAADIPVNAWNHLRIEIKGKRARLYFRDMKQPALVIHDLKHGISKGSIGVYGNTDGTSFFSNFSYRHDPDLDFPPETRQDVPPGIISQWEISQSFDALSRDSEAYPGPGELSSMKWRTIPSERSGLCNIARVIQRTSSAPPLVYARTVLHTDQARTLKLNLGYSDVVSLFCNGTLMFQANSSYQLRDRSFLGIIGLNDAVYLPLKKGKNEILLAVTETFGGWGFMCQDGEAVYQDVRLTERWKTGRVFTIPETVVYDETRYLLYVSNYSPFSQGAADGGASISTMLPDGTIQQRHWLAGLNRPVGMAIHKNTLYVVETRSLVEVDLTTGAIVSRHQSPMVSFLNDIAIDGNGILYITDSNKHTIFKFSNGTFEPWLTGTEVRQPNGLHIEQNTLFFGNNGDNSLKSVDLVTKTVRTVVQLNQGIIDGIESDGQGNLLVSHNEGRVFHITPAGVATKLLDLTARGTNCANFLYLPSKSLLVIPSFADNRVIAYTATFK